MSPDTTYRRSSRLSASCIFLTVTLIMTATASGLMSLALMTDHWEYIEFDPNRVARVTTNETEIQWMMGDRVARLAFTPNGKGAASSKRVNIESNEGVEVASTASIPFLFWGKGRTAASKRLLQQQQQQQQQKQQQMEQQQNVARGKRGFRTVYLVPMYGGVWQICTHLQEAERKQLAEIGYGHAWCKQYLSLDSIVESGSNDWMTRMQNLSISCAIVCLILLGTSALIGLFGILKGQMSAVLVTGVMYILAAVFCVFTLSIMQFKRKTSKDCGLVDSMIPIEYQHAQMTTTGWSFFIGWLGVSLCVVTAFLWYLLSKIMRYGPITLTQPN